MDDEDEDDGENDDDNNDDEDENEDEYDNDDDDGNDDDDNDDNDVEDAGTVSRSGEDWSSSVSAGDQSCSCSPLLARDGASPGPPPPLRLLPAPALPP